MFSNQLSSRIFSFKSDESGLYLLRADQDLIEKFLPPTIHRSTLRRSSITDNEIEYFIVNQEMISRVLNDHKPIRKVETPNSPSPNRRKSSTVSSPSLSTHQRFFSQSLLNETIKINDEQRSLQDILATRTAEQISTTLKVYVDGWNELCLYLTKALQENGCWSATTGSGTSLLMPALERWLFVCATNATNRQLKNLLLDILMKYGGKETMITRT